MEYVPDHPIIRACELTGYPFGQEKVQPPICPICKEETDSYYIGCNNEILGCEYCIKNVDAWDWDEQHNDY